MSTKSFAELGVSEPAVRVLSKRGIETPFAIQEKVLPDALAGRDVLAQSPTGSGKTLAFLLPVLQRLERGDAPASALILAPTRELAGQIVDDAHAIAKSFGIEATAIYGGVGFGQQLKAVRTAHLLVATPGRLEDLIARRAVNLKRVRILVLDEADRMLDMGFRPAVDRIVSATPKDRQTLFFSATFGGEAGKLAKAYTRDAKRHEYVPVEESTVRVQHEFVPVVHEAKFGTLVDHLRERERGLALVFVRTKRGADRVVKRLAAQGVDAVAMHGDKSQGQRERALSSFESGRVDVLVATDVAARGIDVAGITHVVNFDAPEDHEGYVHRTGRTGRAGRDGVAITYVLEEQAKDVGTIARALGLQQDFERAGFTTHVQAGPPRSRRRAPRGRR
jgi:superfamily II DNA/RNA helicase